MTNCHLQIFARLNSVLPDRQGNMSRSDSVEGANGHMQQTPDRFIIFC